MKELSVYKTVLENVTFSSLIFKRKKNVFWVSGQTVNMHEKAVSSRLPSGNRARPLPCGYSGKSLSASDRSPEQGTTSRAAAASAHLRDRQGKEVMRWHRNGIAAFESMTQWVLPLSSLPLLSRPLACSRITGTALKVGVATTQERLFGWNFKWVRVRRAGLETCLCLQPGSLALRHFLLLMSSSILPELKSFFNTKIFKHTAKWNNFTVNTHTHHLDSVTNILLYLLFTHLFISLPHPWLSLDSGSLGWSRREGHPQRWGNL